MNVNKFLQDRLEKILLKTDSIEKKLKENEKKGSVNKKNKK
jgi:hypothetical protein